MTISIVTNAAQMDAGRLARIIPHWLRVFGSRVTELCVLLDAKPPAGRIAGLHATTSNLGSVRRVLEQLAREHACLRWRELDYAALPGISQCWWTRGHPVRCHAGSPVFAFAASILEARSRFVFRADCDMLFRDTGWVEESLRLLASGECDLVSPPRLGQLPADFSSRAFMLDWPAFQSRFLPMAPAKLDPIRALHRRLLGRSSALSFESTLNREVQSGRIRHVILPDTLGSSMHIFRAEDAEDPRFPSVLTRWETGDIPSAQLESGWDWNYCRDSWLDGVRSGGTASLARP